MKSAGFVAVAAAILAATISTASADALLGSYTARISDQDHYASDSYPLSTGPQMIRQDRANWHQFNKYDAEDQNDDWFGDKGLRDWLEKALNNSIDDDTNNAIINGTPLVQVDVYQHSAYVSIVEY
jgi:hypothetical protein